VSKYSINKAHFQYYNTGLSIASIVIESSWHCSTERQETNKTGETVDDAYNVLYYDNLIMLYTCCVFLCIIVHSYGTNFTMSMFLCIHAYVHVLWIECRTQSQHEDS